MVGRFGIVYEWLSFLGFARNDILRARNAGNMGSEWRFRV